MHEIHAVPYSKAVCTFLAPDFPHARGFSTDVVPETLNIDCVLAAFTFHGDVERHQLQQLDAVKLEVRE